VLAQLELTFTDGTRQVIATEPGWRIAESPIRESQIRVGEIYDARLEQVGWDTAQFDDTHWRDAEVAPPPSCQLVAQVSPPIRAVQILKPIAITQPRPNIYVFDFGQCFAGWCRLHAKGTLGSRIELRFAELVLPSGAINQDRIDIGEPKQDVFILRGDAAGETFEPLFTYRGFRYVEVSGLTTEPTLESLEGVFAHSDLKMTGQLRIDSPLIQKIWSNTVQTQRSNFTGIPTDCPSREQRGWTAEANVFWDAAAFNMDVAAFTTRQMGNVIDEQAANGAFHGVLGPRHGNSLSLVSGGPVLADGAIVLPWTVWRRYGDLEIIEQNWDAMNRHLQFVLTHNSDHLWRKERGFGGMIGEWLALATAEQREFSVDPGPETSMDLIATACWARSTDLLAQMSRAIGRTQDAVRLRALFESIRRAFNEAFVKSDGTVGTGTQTSYIIALGFGMLPLDKRRNAAELLAADVRRRGVSLTTGAHFTAYSLDVLAEAGFADLSYGLLLRTDFPSWGDMIGRGATTIWESWNGVGRDFGHIHKYSQNHFALGAVCGFLFRRIAGIDAAEPGFESIVVRPVFDPRVKRGGGDYDSVMGRISTDWDQSAEGGFTLGVTIPANTSARIHLPAQRNSRIEEGGREISRHSDIVMVNRLDHEAVIDVASGIYHFLVRG
jgi:alpha-L-rhamnosidase